MQRTIILAAGFGLAITSLGCSNAPASAGSDTDDPAETSPSSSASGTDSGPDSDAESDSDSDDDSGSTGGDPDGLPDTAPTVIELLADSGFTDASAIAAAPDGSEFYFAAYDEAGLPGIFKVDLAGTVEALHVGAPLAYPSDITVTCDGSTLLVSDVGGASTIDATQAFEETPDEILGGIFSLSPEGGVPTAFTAQGVGRAAGVIVSVDCEEVYISGYTMDGTAAVFRAPVAGGEATSIHEGAPLVAPTGIHVDTNNVAWVMDHYARSGSGAQGLLFAIDDSGDVEEVVAGLGMGRHGGVSLAPGGVTAIIPVSDDLGGSRLVTANTEDGGLENVPTAEILEPSGVAAARNAPVMGIAAESAIYLATYE
ncbi:MAG: hypothetical protein KUG77_22130 [Nannocystaceae bacterium]|nr:hypothetical protein [Nannocystaceae bacterium]